MLRANVVRLACATIAFSLTMDSSSSAQNLKACHDVFRKTETEKKGEEKRWSPVAFLTVCKLSSGSSEVREK